MSQIVESLFGVSPERYQQQKDAALQQEALAYAQLDPLQRATAGIYAGARGLAGGIGRMLGGEDPGMRRVTEQDQIIRSIDLNNPETFGPAAQRAYQMGHTELAQKIMLEQTPHINVKRPPGNVLLKCNHASKPKLLNS